ncbi:shikimate dehydrogenase [Polymorphobacter sp. PAMC 29334]|uniref:shikimate dehydrogenase n=1 Tax=Polymorphobacter sp. PAMC 29334 TaxID=2862331 RepID=UPI001C740265|nr:shikimate dehydrogenase [Polymorphobacter sp. PAMC 29334]QYE35724.1 shikimate dehydrogenase [Polymorphobacter sp. PAMC 29334]
MSFASAGVIGWPVAHSKSPLIHRFWLAKLGIDGDYGRFPVAPEHLGTAIDALPALGLSGVNVTAPHKVEVMRFLDRVDPRAARVGAVNTVVVEGDTRSGYNSDIDGVTEALRGIDLSGSVIVVIGTGGAARAAFAALSGTRHREILVVSRNPRLAAETAREFDIVATGVPMESIGSCFALADLIVNASPRGMHGQPELYENVQSTLTHPFTVVFDMVYAPLETALLAAARARGLRTIDGLQMLVGQAAAAFELFYGAPAPRDHDAELRALLIA